MGSENSLFYEGLVDYLTRNQRNQSEQALLHENRELRITLENMHNEYLQLKANNNHQRKIIDQVVGEREQHIIAMENMHNECLQLKASNDLKQDVIDELYANINHKQEIIDGLIGENYPKVASPNSHITKCCRIIKFKKILLSKNGIKADDEKAIDALPLNTKRLINASLLAFGELMSLSDIVLNYVRTNLNESLENMKSEANILGQAITKNNGLEVDAIQAWGYLQMSMSMVYTNSDFIMHGLSVINDEDKANEWLINRMNQLVENLEFHADSPMPNENSIPNPMELWEIKQIEEFYKLKSISSRVAGDRTSYIFDVNKTDGYPRAPKDEEFIQGPVSFAYDKALLWGVKLMKSNSEFSVEELVNMTLNRERIPTLLNKYDQTRLDTLPSKGSVALSLLNNYGIKN